MGPIDIIIIAVVVVTIGLAAFYIYKSKKAGKKCVGCPYSSSCGKSTTEGCCCSGSDKK